MKPINKNNNFYTQNMHLLKVKLNREYRNLPIGLEIDFKQITLLVGEQGCGKSSLIGLLNDSEGIFSDYLNITLTDEVNKNGIDTFLFDSETMNPRTSSLDNYSNPDGSKKGIGYGGALASRFKSHGEVLREFTVNAIPSSKDCVLFLDEPESALSVKNQYLLSRHINEAPSRNVQLVISTHCIPIIESVPEVYSLEHKRWMESKEFIESSKKI